MKGILEFNLPEDSDDFKNASNVNTILNILWDVDNRLRASIKHGELSEETIRELEEVRDLIYLNENPFKDYH